MTRPETDLTGVGEPCRASTWTVRVRRRAPVASTDEERIALLVDAALEAACVWARESLRRDGIVVDVDLIGRPDPLVPTSDLTD